MLSDVLVHSRWNCMTKLPHPTLILRSDRKPRLIYHCAMLRHQLVPLRKKSLLCFSSGLLLEPYSTTISSIRNVWEFFANEIERVQINVLQCACIKANHITRA